MKWVGVVIKVLKIIALAIPLARKRSTTESIGRKSDPAGKSPQPGVGDADA